MDGERVITMKEYGRDEKGRRYLQKKIVVIQETREVLKEELYSSSSRRPYARYVERPYFLA